MEKLSVAQKAMAQGKGILRLAPNWVPRSFCVPGRRIKLHPDDYYVLGGQRGGIDERWFSSTTPAKNGPLTGEHEGLSFVVIGDGDSEERMLLKDVVSELKGALIGARLWDEYEHSLLRGVHPTGSRPRDRNPALSEVNQCESMELQKLTFLGESDHCSK